MEALQADVADVVEALLGLGEALAADPVEALVAGRHLLAEALLVEVARRRARPTTAWPWLGERKFAAGLIWRTKWLHTFLDFLHSWIFLWPSSQLADEQATHN